MIYIKRYLLVKYINNVNIQSNIFIIKNKLKTMNKEEILGLLRHTLTFVGGVLLTNGLLEEGLIQEAIGAVVTLTGVVLSVLSKRKK